MKVALDYPHYQLRFMKSRKEIPEDVQTLQAAKDRRDALERAGHAVSMFKVEQRGRVLAHILVV